MRKNFNETEESFNNRKIEVRKALGLLFKEDIIDDDGFDELFDRIDNYEVEECQDYEYEDYEEDEENEECEDYTLHFDKISVKDASKLLVGGKLHLIHPTYDSSDESEQAGIDFVFQFKNGKGGSDFRDLLVKTDGKIMISEEY